MAAVVGVAAALIGMNIVTQGIVGVGLFGTRRGLSARGGGALRGLDAAPQVLEFRGRGGDTSALPQEGEEVVFRRVAKVHGGPFDEKELDIIGVLAAARDVNRRAGFQGACAAVRHGDLGAYVKALEEARRLLDQSLEGKLDHDAISSWSEEGGEDSNQFSEQAGEDLRAASRLELLGGLAQAVRLHLQMGIESPDERIEEGLRQVSWLDDNHEATVLVFYAPRSESRPIDWALIRECRELKQAEIERIEDDYEHAYNRHLRELEREYARPGNQLQGEEGEGKSPGGGEDLEDREDHGYTADCDADPGDADPGDADTGDADPGGGFGEGFDGGVQPRSSTAYERFLADFEAELESLRRRVHEFRR